MHAEYPGATGTPIVTALACSLAATEISIDVTAGSRISAAHNGATTLTERTNCNYGLEPSVAHVARSNGLAVTAIDDTGEVRAVEALDSRFFVATLYQPQLSSTATQPHPLLVAFVAAAASS